MSSSLALRSLFKSLVSRESLVARAPGLHGLTTQAKAFAVAGAAQDKPSEPVLLVVPVDADIDGMIANVRFFLGAMEGLSDTQLAGAVLPFPSLQVE